jgi:outer membrane protein OmpA-like peptidoglycan-associated protein
MFAVRRFSIRGLEQVAARLRHTCAAGVVAILLTLTFFHASAEEVTTAEGKGQVLDISGQILEIKGITLGVEGALADLGAKVTAQEIKIALSGDVLFDFDKDTLRPDALPTLQNLATVVAKYPKAPILIEGYTDSKGKHDYNIKLSDRRAASVKTWLAKNSNTNAALIKTKGLGETNPVAPNAKPDGSDDPAGRQKNRRVEITITTN